LNILKNAHELFGQMTDVEYCGSPKGEKIYNKEVVKMLECLSYGIQHNDYRLIEIDNEIKKIIKEVKEGTKLF